ncbi:MAG: metalloregulator ArsR/SmtB family transcription factor [Candidatus Eisenbacteria bacterium]|nr:metalloregulator ArsR/SmtB family transcription factor [Candidatus Eisenbacteria bacterium]
MIVVGMRVIGMRRRDFVRYLVVVNVVAMRYELAQIDRRQDQEKTQPRPVSADVLAGEHNRRSYRWRWGGVNIPSSGSRSNHPVISSPPRWAVPSRRSSSHRSCLVMADSRRRGEGSARILDSDPFCFIIRNMSNDKIIDVDRLADTFKALSNPHRLRIFLRLVSCCAATDSRCAESELKSCAGEIGNDLGIAPSTVSHHLKELRRAGLIRMERRGKMVDCSIDPQNLQELSHVLLSELFPARIIP